VVTQGPRGEKLSRPSRTVYRRAGWSDANRPLYGALLLVATISLWSCASSGQREQNEGAFSGSGEFSDASIDGTYTVNASLKPYVKFGGPQVGSGELRYDGQGNVSGHVIYFGVTSDLKGTYHVNSDGTGTSSYTTTTESGITTSGETKFRIVNADEVEFESKGSENRDWASAATVTQSRDNGVFGTLRRKSERQKPVN
jgi:hypothetical protein